MSILMFDHTTRLYLPADRLLREGGVRELAAAYAARRTEEEGDSSSGRERAKERLERAYHPEEGAVHEREPVVTAEQIMSSPVVALGPRATMEEARALFRERRFRHVPILSKDRLVGILSDRDLLRHAGEPPEAPVRPLVTEAVIAASPNTGIREIARGMFEHHIGAMPILGEEGRLVGIITRSDILRTLINRAPLELWV